VAEDADKLHALADDREIADTTQSIPHPYSLTAVKSWIVNLPRYFEMRSAVHFAVSIRESRELVGCVLLRELDRVNSAGEIEFWIGKSWWGQGYASEATREVVRFGFSELSLHRITAQVLARDERSAHVLDNLSMQFEGILRQRLCKWGRFEDVRLYSLLKQELGGNDE
jgi:RimJ/RimL family protein N-acetyltransferase